MHYCLPMLSSRCLHYAVCTIHSSCTNDEAISRRRLVSDARSRMEHLQAPDSSQGRKVLSEPRICMFMGPDMA